MRTGREVAIVVLACAALSLPGLGRIPFYTRGEPREGLVVREMLDSGAWLVPRRPGGEPTRKPPLYYWIAAPVFSVLRAEPELALRLPSALLGTVGVLATWAAARLAIGPAAALPSALVLATSFEWARAATSARVDMALAAMLSVVLCGWMAILAGWRRTGAAIGFSGAALATLAKGPVGLVLPALAAIGCALATRDRGVIKRLHAVPQLAGAALVAGSWYVAAFAREGTAFLNVVVRENLLRFVDPEEAGTGHAHSAGYLIALGLVGLLPWTPLLPLALATWRNARRSVPLALAGAWLATGTVFFALAAAKRSVYLLPVFPAAALLIGAATDATSPASGGLLATATLRLYPLLAIVTGITAVLLGLTPVGSLAVLLGPEATGELSAISEVAHEHAALLCLLAALTLAAAFGLAGYARRRAIAPMIVLVAALGIAWTAIFERSIHPGLAERTSLKRFLTDASDQLPVDAVLHASFPPDPGLRFYAPRPLARWPGGDPKGTRYVLLWDDEWQRLGIRPELTVLAISTTTQRSRGRLRLVRVAPRG